MKLTQPKVWCKDKKERFNSTKLKKKDIREWDKTYIFSVYSSLEVQQCWTAIEAGLIIIIGSNHMFVRCNHIFLNIGYVCRIPPKIWEYESARPQLHSCIQHTIWMVSHDHMILPPRPLPFLLFRHILHQFFLLTFCLKNVLAHVISFFPFALCFSHLAYEGDRSSRNFYKLFGTYLTFFGYIYSFIMLEFLLRNH